MNRLEKIRKQEKQYHDHCYENHRLFEPGSWLHKPVKTIMDLLPFFQGHCEVNVLDLGCGVGRNSIPIAETLINQEGQVVCVDLLESAITNLEKYAQQYGVANKLHPVQSDVDDFQIQPQSFDFIFSVSALEHLESEAAFDDVFHRMIAGTRKPGINCIIMSTDIRETVVETGESLEPMYELLFKTEYLVGKLKSFYENWVVLKHTIRRYEIEIVREGQRVLLQSNVVTWAVQG